MFLDSSRRFQTGRKRSSPERLSYDTASLTSLQVSQVSLQVTATASASSPSAACRRGAGGFICCTAKQHGGRSRLLDAHLQALSEKKKWRLVGNGAVHMQHGSGPLHSQCRPLRADMNKICHPHYIRPKRPAPTETAGWIAVIKIQWPPQKHSVCWSRRRGRGAERRKGGNHSQSILSSSSSHHPLSRSTGPKTPRQEAEMPAITSQRARVSLLRHAALHRNAIIKPDHTHTYTLARTYTHTLR